MSNWKFCVFRYNKDEAVKIGDDKIFGYTHLLVEQKGKYFYENEHLQQSHDTLESVNCFNSIGIEYRSIFPVKIKTKPCIVLLRRKLDFQTPLVTQNQQIVTPLNASTEMDPFYVVKDQHNIDTDDNTDANETDLAVDDTNEWDMVDANSTIVAVNELKKPTKNTKLKIKRFIETHFRAKQTSAINDNEPTESAVPAHKQSAKSSIRNIIKSEKIKEIAERISQMDLKSMCDLENDSVKSCLMKIIDEHEMD